MKCRANSCKAWLGFTKFRQTIGKLIAATPNYNAEQPALVAEIWVLNQDNQVEYRRVVPGAHVESLRVIKKALTEQDRVLVEGLQKVRPGIKVAPEQISLTGEQ